MTWFVLSQIFSTLLSLLRLSCTSEKDKDLEIPILRQQLGILQRRQEKPIKPNRAEKLTLAVLSANLKSKPNDRQNSSGNSSASFNQKQFGWHRQLVKRKWTYAQKNKVGRPPTTNEVKALVIKLALENNWGYGKISGELEKLGIELSETAVGNILKAEGIEPAPVRAGSIGWKKLMSHYPEQLLACDFFSIETIFLKTLTVFFIIDIGTRRVYLAGVTDHPNGHWITQQARNQICLLDERVDDFCGLIRDNDKKFPQAFDDVFESVGIHIIRIPYRAPNALAERWVRTVR